MRREIIGLLCILSLAAPLEAANVVAIADNTLTTAATWATTDATGTLISTSTSTTALTTGNLDSASFVLANSQVGGFVLRLGSRASGSPSNTMTVILRNSTTSSNTCSVTVNVSDLPAADTTADQGGWFYFKCASAFTPNGSDSYVIRATLSATTTAVALSTNGTANNWQHITVRTTTGAPAAGDDMHIVEQFDGASNPATVTTRTVTMDSTASTSYGSANTSYRVAALNISKGATLTNGTAASTTYILQLAGWLVVYSGGTLSIGTSGTPIPATSTATYQHVLVADGDNGTVCRNESTCNIYGSPRTAGKNFAWTMLTADAAASATSLTVADDTGWLSGDTIAIVNTLAYASTTQGETRTLTGNAGASSLAVAALTNAHGGSATTHIQAEVLMLTRNVVLTTTSATLISFFDAKQTATVVIKWAEFARMGQGNTNGALHIETTTGSLTVQYCAFTGSSSTNETQTGIVLDVAARNNFTIDNNVFWNIGDGPSGGFNVAIDDQVSGASTTNWSITNNVIGANTSDADRFAGIRLTSPGGTVSGNHTTGANRYGLWIPIANRTAVTIGSHYSHSNGTDGIVITGSAWGGSLNCVYCGRNTGQGIQIASGAVNFEVSGQFTGNGTAGTGIYLGLSSGIFSDLRLVNVVAAGDAAVAQQYGVYFFGSNHVGMSIENSTFGVGTVHTTADIGIPSSDTPAYVKARNVTFNTSTPFPLTTNLLPDAFIGIEKWAQTNGSHRTYVRVGQRIFNTTTVHTTYSEQLVPSGATTILKLKSGPHYTSVPSGSTRTPCVWIRKDGSYVGSAPRLMVESNYAIGVNGDTVLGTFSAGANTWQQVCGATVSATDDGTFTFYVDIDGSAGNVYVADWSVS